MTLIEDFEKAFARPDWFCMIEEHRFGKAFSINTYSVEKDGRQFKVHFPSPSDERQAEEAALYLQGMIDNDPA